MTDTEKKYRLAVLNAKCNIIDKGIKEASKQDDQAEIRLLLDKQKKIIEEMGKI
jgi:hypothetical protein